MVIRSPAGVERVALYDHEGPARASARADRIIERRPTDLALGNHFGGRKRLASRVFERAGTVGGERVGLRKQIVRDRNRRGP